MIEPIRLGTRGSALALWQANTIRDLIIQAHPEQPVELLIADSQGDKDQKTPLAALGGTGVFVKQLEAELLAGNVDLAVHSAKDLPASMPTGLELAAAPVRGVVNDALIMSNGNSLSDLPTGSVVGTSSPRRVASLKHIRPDLKTVNIRGNVQTRIRKVDEGEVDATLLALVGLQRLGLESRVNDTLPLHQFLPAAGQGIVAVQIRADDNRLQKLLQPINHKATWKCLIAERALLRRLNAGCHAALGALSTMQSEEQMQMSARVMSLDGSEMIEFTASVKAGIAPESLADIVADHLTQQGAERLLEDGVSS